jgi:hypothetical protein
MSMAAATSCGCSAKDMTVRARALLTGVACACLLGAPGGPAIAQEGAGSFGPAVLPVGRAAVGEDIASVAVEIAASSGQQARDDAARAAARAAVAPLVGRDYAPVLVDAALADLVAAGTLRAARHRTVYDGARGGLGVVVSLDVAAAPEAVAAPSEPARFPDIIRDDRTQLSFILGGGVGAYSDTNPWFGAPDLFNSFSPIAGELPGSRTTWPEAYLEFGLGGATRLGDSDLYLFGAATGITAFRRDRTSSATTRAPFCIPERVTLAFFMPTPRPGTRRSFPSAARPGR